MKRKNQKLLDLKTTKCDLETISKILDVHIYS